MKKSLLLILACFFAVFMLFGCGDSSDDNTPALDPLPEISSLKGTYNIEFFYTDGGGYSVVTTDCDNVTKYVGNDAKQCNKKYGNVEYTGKMTLDVLDNGNVKIVSKIQMAGGGIDALGGVAIDTGDNYQYTEYSTIPNGAISTYIINDTATNNAVTGVTGRNRISKTSDETATYTFTYDKANNILINNMINTKKISGIGDVKANVVIRLKKESEIVDNNKVNPNEKFPTPDIKGTFEQLGE